MKRLNALKTLLQDRWPDPDTKWLVGAEYIHSEEGAKNRIVLYAVGGPIRQPSTAAQGWNVEDIEPTAIGEPNARDDVLWERRVQVNASIWGRSSDDAENRLHALLSILAEAFDQSNITLEDLQEQWVRATSQDIASGGELVILSFTVPIHVLTTDSLVIDPALADSDDPESTGAPIGTGQEHELPDSVTIIHKQDDETIVTDIILPPEET